MSNTQQIAPSDFITIINDGGWTVRHATEQIKRPVIGAMIDCHNLLVINSDRGFLSIVEVTGDVEFTNGTNNEATLCHIVEAEVVRKLIFEKA